MKMDFDDEELDRLFKNKANGPAEEPEFDEAAWADMEQRLDQRKRRFAFYYLSAAALFLGILSFGWLLMKNDGWIGNKTEKNYTAKNKLIKTENKASEIGNSQDNTSENTLRKQTENFSKLDNTISAKTKLATADDYLVNAKRSLKKQSVRLNTESTTSDHTTNYANEITKNDKGISLIKRVQQITFSENSEQLNELIIKPILFQDVLAKTDLKTKSEILPSKVIWSLGFNAGPEFNTAGNLDHTKANFNGGISFSGQLKKFSLGIGANYGVKNYSATPYQYHNIKPQFVPLITNVNASCNILEVPLSISYQLFSGKKSSFDVNAGLSSYFMLKEKYVYQYTASSGYPERTIRVNNQNQHYFKVLQLSATYYLPLKNSSNNIGIEPFAKIPLAGVGIGSVELKSYGVNFHFNYQLKKK